MSATIVERNDVVPIQERPLGFAYVAADGPARATAITGPCRLPNLPAGAPPHQSIELRTPVFHKD